MADPITEQELKQLLQYLPFLRTQLGNVNPANNSNASYIHNVQTLDQNLPVTSQHSVNLESVPSVVTETQVMPQESIITEVICENTSESITTNVENANNRKKPNGKQKFKSKHSGNNCKISEKKDIGNFSSSDLSEDNTNVQSKSVLNDQNRKRMTKFSDEELEVLIREISEKYNLLYGSLACKISNQRKNQIWESIKNKVCSVGVGQRTVIQLKKRWLDIRR
ncbi:hypothetical protein XELAEV_18004344mg [Xenopus laevis]|uniref:Myb/SANT-like DNA-binding domain-containing protein n=1 Tax=Xenopus laevis TaxID=8355 RepID=A0A974BRG0_XENLA|nr:hypothetical protein XELAEV_18004344mg [Xenopus laevis]